MLDASRVKDTNEYRGSGKWLALEGPTGYEEEELQDVALKKRVWLHLRQDMAAECM